MISKFKSAEHDGLFGLVGMLNKNANGFPIIL